MKTLEEQMNDVLEEILNLNGELIVKADFEAEGTRLNELSFLNSLVGSKNGKLYIKIGGCEAVYDLQLCKDFRAAGVMVPMVETAFALEKFKMAVERVYGDCYENLDFIVNAETKTTALNFDEILKKAAGLITGITIGRVDLSASFGLKRKDIDCQKVLKSCEFFAKSAKEAGFLVSVGGGILKDSFKVLEKIKDYIDRFETRKFVFMFDGNEKTFNENILLATKFELLFLKYKSEQYLKISKEDEKRIKILSERV